MSDHTKKLEKLYEANAPGLIRFFLAGTADRATAEDLLQDTFQEIVRHAERVIASDSPRAYMYGIARNLRRGMWKRQLPTDMIEDQSEIADHSSEEDPRLEIVRHEIKNLTDYQREILELRVHHGLQYSEIAAALNIPIGTVRSRIHKAISQLRKSVIHHENS